MEGSARPLKEGILTEFTQCFTFQCVHHYPNDETCMLKEITIGIDGKCDFCRVCETEDGP